MNKWDIRYMQLAKMVSTWSKDPRKKVGAIVTEDGYVYGMGFNGFPRGITDAPHRLDNKELKNLLMIHAEENALHLAKGHGDTVYVYPCLPCSHCLGILLTRGIKRIVTLPARPSETAWRQDLVLELAQEAGVEVTFIEEDLLMLKPYVGTKVGRGAANRTEKR